MVTASGRGAAGKIAGAGIVLSNGHMYSKRPQLRPCNARAAAEQDGVHSRKPQETVSITKFSADPCRD